MLTEQKGVDVYDVALEHVRRVDVAEKLVDHVVGDSAGIVRSVAVLAFVVAGVGAVVVVVVVMVVVAAAAAAAAAEDTAGVTPPPTPACCQLARLLICLT